MGLRHRQLRGSFTVEASWVMALTLLAVLTMLQASCRLHDRTVGAMVLHETVETARHEKKLDPREAARLGEEHMKLLYAIGGLELDEQGGAIHGRARAGAWEKEIEGQCFRPEEFLRKITLLEQLGERDGDSL